MRILAIDPGSRRIGVAWTDALLMTAQPGTLIEGATPEERLERIAAVCVEREAALVVVGLPRNFDGTEGAEARAARELMGKIQARVGLPVVAWDERLSSHEADDILDQKGYRRTTKRGRQRRKAERDVLAACMILRSFMEAKGDEIRARGVDAVVRGE